MRLTITAADILVGARNHDWYDARIAWDLVNNGGDGFDPEDDHLGTLVGSRDGLAVYDDSGDAVIVADDGDGKRGWAVRISADEPVTFTDET